MCYTTNIFVNMKTEVNYNSAKPYGENGYRSNCNDIWVWQPIESVVSCEIVKTNIVMYCILSLALKNTANQRPGLPLHILRYATAGVHY